MPPTRPLCLVVAADPRASLAWRRGLEPWGLRPYAVPHVPAALDVLGQCRFDALLVDGDGVDDGSTDDGARRVAEDGARRDAARLPDALSALRARTAAPLLVVWSETGDARQIDALAAGASATLVRPASPARIGATLRRLVDLARDAPPEAAGPDAVRGPLHLDVRRATASCGGRPLDLTASELALLALLAERGGEVVSREAIVGTLLADRQGKGRGLRDTHRSTDMHVCRLRRKLETAGAEAAGVRLATVHGRGYALRVESASGVPEALRAAA